MKIHRVLGGKLKTCPKKRIRSMEDLSLYYTPGVGDVAKSLERCPALAHDLTIKKNTVAVVSDGSAVLGLGNIGPEGALPVMEGKAMIFKEFAGVDAFPIVLSTQNPKEVVQTILNISPGFGGINLEDIKAPECFEIERELVKKLDIPVMHDDQHGTAIVVLAGLLNAFKVVGKNIRKSTVVIVGSGAAGIATAKLLHKFGVGGVIVVDSKGIVHKKRKGLTPYKRDLARMTNPPVSGRLDEAILGADAVVGVSGPRRISKKQVASMGENAIVFALANPVPEIMPEDAKKAGAAVTATGRSDFPNQVNNALVFPGIFRGAFDRRVQNITDEMKIRAAKNLAGVIKKPTRDKIIPSIFDKKVMPAVSRAIK